MDFASNSSSKNIMVISPDYIFKTSLKTYLLDSLKIDNSLNTDSVLLANSRYLSNLDDSLFLANYILGFSKSLSAFGFNVYDQDQSGLFLALDSNTYQINIAQIEIEETLYTYRDETDIYDNYFYHDHNLNAIYVNSWFELSNPESIELSQKVFFTTDLITDIPDGVFDYDIFSGKVKYMYNIDSLEQNMLYSFAYRIGTEYAKYAFDYLLNQDLNKKLPPHQRSSRYWRYDVNNHIFYPATDDKFMPLNN
ncbi:MAG: hypothetical protein P8I80_06915 [Bacteroidales bacterium]|jgi:hypothetical protein|nr:hypothetical protein [Bacteroidales bacterium]|tara:strand:- start:29680 stop:30432 length:753 start_codon:yes stop_codon:yes gene_type:complete